MRLLDEIVDLMTLLLSVLVDAIGLLLAGLALVVLLENGAGRGCSKEKAYLTAMRSDLRNLVTVQEESRDAIRTNSSDLRETLDLAGFRWSTGVELVDIRAMRGGFTAEVAYINGTSKHCRVSHVWGREPAPTCDD